MDLKMLLFCRLWRLSSSSRWQGKIVNTSARTVSCYPRAVCLLIGTEPEKIPVPAHSFVLGPLVNQLVPSIFDNYCCPIASPGFAISDDDDPKGTNTASLDHTMYVFST